MKKKVMLIGFLLTASVIGGLVWTANRAFQPAAPAAPKIITVDRGAIRQIVTASGVIAANYEVDIKCKASGEVIRLPYDVSDFVKKDALIMELNPVDEQRRVDQQKAALAAAECRLNNARQTLKIAEQTLVTDTKQAEVNLRSAEVNAQELDSKAQRSRKLLDVKLLSLEEWETADSAAKRALASVDQCKNALEALKIRPIAIEKDRNEVTLSEIAVETAKTDLDEAELRLKETKVIAPIDGVVTTRPVQIGSIVSSGITNIGGGSSVMTLSDLSRLLVLAPVDEADIGHVKLEQPVEIRCDAFPNKKFQGKVIHIAARGLNQQNVVTFPVKIEVLGEGKDLLKPEMTADSSILVAQRDKVLRVPSEAVLTHKKEQTHYVLIPRDRPAATNASTTATTATASAPATGPTTNIATIERPVVIGADDGAFCEILSGLAEGDKVVIDTSVGGDWSKLKINPQEEGPH